MKNCCLAIYFSLSTMLLLGQVDLSLEVQLYPTGFIPSISLDYPISQKGLLYGRIGLNIFDHRDLGVQDKEKGSGYGFSLGYKHYFSEEFKGWRLALKSDIWRNQVEWKDSGEQGTSNITVLQPVMELSYVLVKPKIVISPSIAFGYEWNIKTSGRPTGEGPIILIGLQIGKRF